MQQLRGYGVWVLIAHPEDHDLLMPVVSLYPVGQHVAGMTSLGRHEILQGSPDPLLVVGSSRAA
jgi:hypothetical protein